MGDRGNYREIKRCSKFNGAWFIVYKDDPQNVEISLCAYIYEPYDFISVKKMKWNKSFYSFMRNKISDDMKKWNDQSIVDDSIQNSTYIGLADFMLTHWHPIKK